MVITGCPLRGNRECNKDGCAWWCEVEHSCSVVVIAESLRRLSHGK